MERDQIKGDWKRTKGKAKEKWVKLTDDDLHVIEGKRERLIAKLQERYSRSKEETQREVDRWIETL